jgi:hypothetical protein
VVHELSLLGCGTNEDTVNAIFKELSLSETLYSLPLCSVATLVCVCVFQLLSGLSMRTFKVMSTVPVGRCVKTGMEIIQLH